MTDGEQGANFSVFFSGRAWLHPATPINPAMLILAKILVAPWVFLAMAPQVQQNCSKKSLTQHMGMKSYQTVLWGLFLKKKPKKSVFLGRNR